MHRRTQELLRGPPSARVGGGSANRAQTLTLAPRGGCIAAASAQEPHSAALQAAGFGGGTFATPLLRGLDATCKRRVGDSAEALARWVDLLCALGHPLQKEKCLPRTPGWLLVRDRAWYLASGVSLQQPGNRASGINPVNQLQLTPLLPPPAPTYLGHFNEFLVLWIFTAGCCVSAQISPALCQRLNLPVSCTCPLTSTTRCFIKVLVRKGAEIPWCSRGTARRRRMPVRFFSHYNPVF